MSGDTSQAQVEQQEMLTAGGAGNSDRRRRKQANSLKFNEILSAANCLSVSEKTRLVRSLAGQVGLVTFGSGELIAKQSNKPSGKVGKPAMQVNRPNPLKGTKFQLEKETALQRLKEAKSGFGGEKLPPNHPAVVAYVHALQAYKAEHAKLVPEESSGPALGSSSLMKKRVKDKSPEPGGGPARKTIVSRIGQAVTRSTSKKPNEQDMDHVL
jgi:hypothetical protein